MAEGNGERHLAEVGGKGPQGINVTPSAPSVAESREAPQIAVGTHFFKQQYLYAFAPQAEVLNHVRTQGLDDESQRLMQILENWRGLQSRVAALVQQEMGLADTIQLSEIPAAHQLQIRGYEADPLFEKTFSSLPVGFALVEVDKLVAPQRSVNLDYVERLLSTYPKTPAVEDLLRICVSSKRDMDPIQHLEVAPNTHIFSSPNSDIRFLGAFVKRLTAEDLDFAIAGGLPAAAVIAFVGYGAAPVNVLQVGTRLVLNNGFHRVYALRSLGIREIPVVVQFINNPALEFPAVVAGLPKEYLLGHPRPVLVKDFFEPEFAITLKVRERIKMVAIAIGRNEHEVPA